MRTRLAGALALAAAWSCFSTLGLEYTAFAACLLAGAWQAHRQRAWHEVWQGHVVLPWLALWLLLLLSTTWSPAAASARIAHLWTYGLVLLMPLAAWAWTPQAAQRALRHFIVAAALVGGMNLLHRQGWLPNLAVWQRIVDAEGNQRIVMSLLMALGGVLALDEALARPQASKRTRAAWVVAAGLCIVGLALQDRRSGMLSLPLLLVVLVFARQRSAWRRVALVSVVGLLALATWQVSDSVRNRFHEGLAEVQAPRTPDTVSTSWGQRLAMIEITAEMVREKPWLGHGVASWPVLWAQRTKPGTPLHEHTTPHNEYLMVATQAGAAGLLLLVVAMAMSCLRAWQAGPAGTATLMAWTMLATSALFNAMLRDAKFALPLLTVAALGVVAARATPPAQAVESTPLSAPA